MPCTVKDVVSRLIRQAWLTGSDLESTGEFDEAVIGDGIGRLSIATVAAAMVEIRWTQTNGSGCPPTPRFRSVSFIGVVAEEL